MISVNHTATIIVLAFDGLGAHNLNHDVDMPYLHQLVSLGARANATIQQSIVSLPNWVAMFSGLDQDQSGVINNGGHYPPSNNHRTWPWIWTLADEHQRTSVLFYDWPGLGPVGPRTTRVDHYFKADMAINSAARDAHLQQAVDSIDQYDFTTIYMGNLDRWCHANDKAQYNVTSKYYDDKVVRPVFNYLMAHQNNTAVMLLSDHSSDWSLSWCNHGRDAIPFTVVAPGLAAGNHGQIAATAAFGVLSNLLGSEPPASKTFPAESGKSYTVPIAWVIGVLVILACLCI